MKLKFRKYVLLSFSSFILIFYIICCCYYVTDNHENSCLMTYMYEYPEYVKVNVNVIDHSYNSVKKYALYSYSEGKYVERCKNFYFTGIPVLFIPGHGGSYKQVRSLASVTAHRTLDLQSIFHFDFFTIDFRGEFSALYGGTLKDQHFFVVSCIDAILSLYRDKNKPESVIIIGHSMGGMIARSLFISKSFKPNTVKLIITLATPHQPVILLDQDLKEFYDVLDEFWLQEKSKNNYSVLENVTMISIGGGSKDVLVRPGLTFSRFADLNVLTSAIPGVHVSTDHLCILWCNNFVKTLSRTLYDAVDIEIKEITQDKNLLKNIFYYHLVHRSNGKYYTTELHQERMKFSKNEHWKEITQNKISLIFHKGLSENTYVIINKPKSTLQLNTIMIEAINIDKRDWIAECNAVMSSAQSTFCEIGNNLSQFGIIGSNSTLKRKYITLSLNSTDKYFVSLSHLIVRIPVTILKTGINVDIYNKQSRIVKVDLDFILLFRSRIVIEKTEHQALTYTIQLNNMHTMWQVYRLYLTPLQCQNKEHFARAAFQTPWNHDSSDVTVSSDKINFLKLILLTIPPEQRTNVPTVELILDPSCRYSVSIDFSYLDSIGIIAIRYCVALMANICAILLLTLSKQYRIFEKKRICPPLLKTLKQNGGPWFLYPIVQCITQVWKRFNLDQILFKWDTQLLEDDTADVLIVPSMLYLVSFAIIYVVGRLLWSSINFNIRILNQLVLKKYAALKLPTESWNLNVIYSLNNFSLGLTVTVLFISWVTCGGMGLLIGVILYYLKICHVYKLCTDTPVKLKILSFSENSVIVDTKTPNMDFVHLHCTLFLLWTLCAAIYFPATLMWFKNIGFGSSRMSDPSFGYNIILSLSVGILWYCNSPLKLLNGYNMLSYPIFIISCFVLLLAQVNIFRITCLLVPIFTLISIHQYCFGLRRLKSSNKTGQNVYININKDKFHKEKLKLEANDINEKRIV